MAAHHHLNPNQMRMFMRPDEIKGSIFSSIDGMPVGSHADWEEKDSDFLRHSVAGSGVKTPVVLYPAHSEYVSPDHYGGGMNMGNGHHRVQNAHRLQQETGQEIYVPVIHDTNYMGTTREMRKSYPGVYKAGGGI